MAKENKFGFAPVEPETPTSRRDRAPGPMGAAVRDVAENLTEATNAKVAQRRQNAEDAKAYRTAQDEGRVLVRLPLAAVETTDLPRDRLELGAVATSDEMDELKASIRERGQKEPVEVYVDGQGAYQIKKGWRRLTALRQLHTETGEEAFATIVARVEHGPADRMLRYVDMVEENVVREDLTFAEMAQVAITAAQDAGVDETDPAELVARLYAALHKTKRSYIRSFVFLLVALGEDLKFPKAVARNLGVDAARAIASEADADALRRALAPCDSPDAQNAAIAAFITAQKARAKPGKGGAEPKQKFEFHVGKTKVTARDGECRIVSAQDYATAPKHLLEEAVKAFEEVLRGPRIR